MIVTSTHKTEEFRHRLRYNSVDNHKQARTKRKGTKATDALNLKRVAQVARQAATRNEKIQNSSLPQQDNTRTGEPRPVPNTLS
jgi:hypothetical protein